MNTNTDDNDFFQGIFFLNVNTGYICGGFMNGMSTSKILKTTDSGFNWAIQHEDQFEFFFAICFINENTGFTGGFDGIFLKTTNAGVNWINFPVTGADIWTIIFLNDNTGYIAGNMGMIRKTTDAGLTWTLMPSGITLRISSLFFTDELNGHGVCDSQTVIRTTNGGLSWTSQIVGNDAGYESIFFTNHNNGYAVGNWWQIAKYKLIKTTNAGITWQTIADGEGDPYFDIYFSDVNTGWIAGYNGLILKTTNAGTTFIEPITKELPDEFCLFQNYPNPFNPKTKLRFSISPNIQGETIQLVIYNSTGQRVETLVDEILNSGEYEVEWNAVNYPSGIYFYKLNFGKNNVTKKMILIK
jgi:photosystem II stability/assembly factor-like uncharacterized protein